MTICYIILAHDNPDQLARLVGALDTPDVSFVIHLDAKMLAEDASRARDLLQRPDIFFVEKRHKVYWGTMSMMDATLVALDTQAERRIRADYTVLLSGSHYPIKSNEFIASFLEQHRGSIFLDYTPIPDFKRWAHDAGGLNRINRWHFCWWGKRWSWKLGTRKFLPGLTPYGGSQWWMLPADAVEHIRSVAKNNRRFMNFFRHANFPDEIFFQTLLMNSSFKERIVTNNLTFLRLANTEASHPDILDLTALETLSKSPALFARKMAVPKSQTLLDAIDQARTTA